LVGTVPKTTIVDATKDQKLRIVVIKKYYLPMNHVVLPSTALLDSNTAPLGLGQEAALGQSLGQLFGENHVTVNIT